MTNLDERFSVSMSMPLGWVNLPTDEAGLEEYELLSQRLSRLADASIPPAIESVLRGTLVAIARDGAAAASYYLDVVDLEDPAARPYVLLSTLLMTTTEIRGSEVPTATEIASELRASWGPSLASVEVFTLSDGREAVLFAPLSPNQTDEIGILDLRVFVPVAQVRQVISLMLRTPNGELRETFVEVLQKVAATMTIELPGDA